ncbi:MAG: hypothetical protein H0X24_00185 [Ktedonobacterales bacterium]|nr:hypothetical protein [Ktedonobacterales bacterium]
MDALAQAQHLLATGQFTAALVLYKQCVPATPHAALRLHLALGLCLHGSHEDEAAFQEFEAGRAIAVMLADVGEVISLDVLAARTLIALARYELLADRLTTDLTKRVPFVAEERLPFLTRELYFWLWEGARAAGNHPAARLYHSIATALFERDLAPDIRALLDQIIAHIQQFGV